jgi:hypothetical protein
MPIPASSAQAKELSPGELSQRVAVIKRFRELLRAQRDRFSAYLNALDKQKDVIESGSTDDLLRHVELEEKIVEDIFSIQKVIDPLEKMYQSTRVEPNVKDGRNPFENPAEQEVSGLKNALESLMVEAAARSERNRELLANRMAELRSEIKSLRRNAYAKRPLDNTLPPSYVDIKG